MKGRINMKRIAYIDNAKFILITFVVFGHMIQPFVDKPYVYTVYTWLYAFIMPVFIVMSGFFAKGDSSKSYIAKIARRTIIPYLIFQILYTGYYFVIGKEEWLKSLFTPHWALWFLMSLFCWHLLLILFKRYKPIYSIAITFGIAIIVGYIDQIGHAFSLSRTISYFPFFLIGHYIQYEHLMKLKTEKMKKIALSFIVFSFTLIAILPNIPVDWLLQSKPYSVLGADWIGGLGRLGVNLLGITLGASVLAWIPTKRYKFTHLGERSIYVYILHGFIVQIFRQFDLLYVNNIFNLVALYLLALAITLVLSTNLIVTVWQPFVELSTQSLKKYRVKRQ